MHHDLRHVGRETGKNVAEIAVLVGGKNQSTRRCCEILQALPVLRLKHEIDTARCADSRNRRRIESKDLRRRNCVEYRLELSDYGGNGFGSIALSIRFHDGDNSAGIGLLSARDETETAEINSVPNARGLEQNAANLIDYPLRALQRSPWRACNVNKEVALIFAGQEGRRRLLQEEIGNSEGGNNTQRTKHKPAAEKADGAPIAVSGEIEPAIEPAECKKA